jgi:hypothetical protein
MKDAQGNKISEWQWFQKKFGKSALVIFILVHLIEVAVVGALIYYLLRVLKWI